jgi:hypothetical protein
MKTMKTMKTITLKELKENKPHLNFIEVNWGNGWREVVTSSFNPDKTKTLAGGKVIMFESWTKKGEPQLPIVSLEKIKGARVKMFDRDSLNDKYFKITF